MSFTTDEWLPTGREQEEQDENNKKSFSSLPIFGEGAFLWVARESRELL
jgi:hypothetical protein